MSRSTRTGLTLIEVIVVVVIGVIVIGLLLPAQRRVRDAATRSMCQNNLKQLVLALHSFEDMSSSIDRPSNEYQSKILPDVPPEHFYPTGCFGPGAKPQDRLSWMVSVLPFIEQDNVYKKFDLEGGYSGNLSVARTPIKMFHCYLSNTPTTAAVTHYIAMSGLGRDASARPAGAPGNGFMGYDRRGSFLSIPDGTANTIALMETHHRVGPWARGGYSTVRPFDPNNVPSLHGKDKFFGGEPFGVNVGMADGSVRFLRTPVSTQALMAAITIDGGEVVNLD